ncbi:serine hydrolase domain-containing protein [Labedaea rhizosphaerae]|uniref:D-alanyl-D-alanine carboxypeptidase n=1 Tax=Labedaea rhizosphaerae TaxID=598644 RepID=A0A4R6SN16_LABRH|nr:serine hydrolase domain-containing protein [Labedaea rhizosphaerae]TDQ05916.1 D-alanyl-D-alanine carboxypeptidase [Labedaea rhizosphaerae]
MKPKRITAIVVAATLGGAVLATPAAAAATTLPPLNPAALEAAIADLPNDEVSGALVQVRGSAGEWTGTSGIGDLRTGRGVPADGRFRIGSMTKTFTATAALQLVARHRLDLDRTVQSYVPDLLPASYPPITVGQLMDFTAGIPGIKIDHKDPVWFLAHRFDTWTPRQLIDLATKDAPMEFAPGTMQHYGNIDYLVLGVVIEKVTGRPYGDAIRDGIIRPLHLTATVVPGRDPRIHGPHAHGYEAVTPDQWVDVTDANPTFQWAAAEIVSNAPDLDRFLVALVSGRLLPPAQTAELFRIPDVPTYETGEPATYGRGLEELVVNGQVFWGKSGDRPGYNNGMGTTLDLARRLVYSVNTLHMGGAMPAVAQRIVLAAVS